MSAGKHRHPNLYGPHFASLGMGSDVFRPESDEIYKKLGRLKANPEYRRRLEALASYVINPRESEES